MTTKKKSSKQGTSIKVAAPNMKTAVFKIRGTAPYVQNRFSQKAIEMIKSKQEAGTTATTKKGNREAKDFKELFELAQHRFHGTKKCGIPVTHIKNAMTSTAKLCGIHMTDARKVLYVEGDGINQEGFPLVSFKKGGTPKYMESYVRIARGTTDIRPRPVYDNWEADVRIKFDADFFTVEDVANLLVRAGMQNGIGEGRPASKSSGGCGWGTFEVLEK